MSAFTHQLFINGKVYGMGNSSYMVELIEDYVKHCDMYGNISVTFDIKRKEDE